MPEVIRSNEGGRVLSTVIRKKEVPLNKSYEPDLPSEDGIHSGTVPDTTFRLHCLTVPPGKRSHAHYHCNTAAGVYIVKGHLRMYKGPPHDQHVIEAEAGDFIHTPKGEIHWSENPSDTESAELIACYPDVPSREAAGRIYTEDPKK